MINLSNKKGFTIRELLVVVVVLGALVAASLPLFNAQLEKSRESADTKILREAYTKCVTAMGTATEPTVTDKGVTIEIDAETGLVTCSTDVELTQKNQGWDLVGDINGVQLSSMPSKGTVTVSVYNNGSLPTFVQKQVQ